MAKRWYLYVLKLEHDKFFVGISTNAERRYNQHVRGRAHKWTKQYKPLKLDLVQDLNTSSTSTAQYYEAMMIDKLQVKYGRHNVEGGDTADITKYVRRWGLRLSERQWEAVIVVVVVAIVAIGLWLWQVHALDFLQKIRIV